jgi:hypothetical protein
LQTKPLWQTHNEQRRQALWIEGSPNKASTTLDKHWPMEDDAFGQTYEVMIEREGYSFAIKFTYERLPSFCTPCKNIGNHITSCRWLHPTKDTHVIEKQKKSIVSHTQQVQKWQPKDNPNDIGSSKAFEAPEVNNVTADSTILQADNIQLQTQPDATSEQEEERSVDVSTLEFQADAHTVQQTDKEPSAITFTIQNVEEEIQQERLPRSSIHV